eukprot:6213872-Pleurochrysis_carterae.AAC.2
MVGHTHEDIDATFKRITDQWREQKEVLTPSGFLCMLQEQDFSSKNACILYLSIDLGFTPTLVVHDQEAIPDATVHPIMRYVHVWASFFRNTNYDNTDGITTARNFVLKERDDGATASTCIRLHKDEGGLPLECRVDGEARLEVCRAGIEVFKNGTGPDLEEIPAIAEFAKDTMVEGRARLEVAEARAIVNTIIKGLPAHLDEAHPKKWNKFFGNFHASAENMPEEEVDRFDAAAIPQCRLHLPTHNAEKRCPTVQLSYYGSNIAIITPIPKAIQ